MNIPDAWLEFWPFAVFLLVVVAGAVLRSAWFKGRMGEFWVNAGLRRELPEQDYHLFKNVTLPAGEGTTQIDHVVISRFGIFVIETKNMTGWIFGGADQAEWTQVIYHHKQRFQNPLRQNYKHVRTVQTLLGVEHDQVHGVVAFVGDSDFKTAMPMEIVEGVHDLAWFIKSKQIAVFDDDQVSSITAALNARRLEPSIRTHATHVRNVQARIAEREDGCPICGGELVERVNRRSGERFLGCARFPKCRGTRALP